jgi:hypothetical protein
MNIKRPALLGYVLTWISLILSYRENSLFNPSGEAGALRFDITDPTTVFATGGWPFKVYDYPVPPMGPGPEQSELPFLANFVVWTAISCLIFYLVKENKLPKRIDEKLVALAIVMTVVGFVYLLFKFD